MKTIISADDLMALHTKVKEGLDDSVLLSRFDNMNIAKIIIDEANSCLCNDNNTERISHLDNIIYMAILTTTLIHKKDFDNLAKKIELYNDVSIEMSIIKILREALSIYESQYLTSGNINTYLFNIIYHSIIAIHNLGGIPSNEFKNFLSVKDFERLRNIIF